MILRQTEYNNWRGAWDSERAYIVYDIIEYNGSSYVCIKQHTNQAPPNFTYWDLLAEGQIGPQGPQGDIGTQGDQGFQGQKGDQGFQGDVGSTGPQGLQGNTGAQGPQGLTGSTGPQGNQGFQGNQGPQGDQGFQGIPGPMTQVGSNSSDGVTNTTSGTYTQKLSLSFTPTVTGTYLLSWSAEVTNSTKNNTTYVQVQQNDTTTLAGEIAGYILTAEAYIPFSGIAILSLTASTVYNFDMDLRRDAATGRIRNARLSLVRLT
jgi:hypothetical protein